MLLDALFLPTSVLFWLVLYFCYGSYFCFSQSFCLLLKCNSIILDTGRAGGSGLGLQKQVLQVSAFSSLLSPYFTFYNSNLEVTVVLVLCKARALESHTRSKCSNVHCYPFSSQLVLNLTLALSWI